MLARAPAGAGNDTGRGRLPSFAVVLVVVSRASHTSEQIAATVRVALAAQVPVIPFVVDPPPIEAARPLHPVPALDRWRRGLRALRGERIERHSHRYLPIRRRQSQSPGSRR